MLADPVRLERFLSSVTSVVKVDSGFNLIRLADELRGLRPSNITFTTVPIATASYVTPTGQDAVLWDAKAATALFSWLKKDAGTARPAGSRSRSRSGSHGTATITRAQVSVDIYNGTLIGGLSATTGAQLTSAGFSVHKAGLNWPVHDVAQTLIEYPSGQAAAARLLAKAMPGAALRVVAGLARIRLVLGVSGHAVVAAASPGTQSSPAATGAPGQSRTAAQDACR